MGEITLFHRLIHDYIRNGIIINKSYYNFTKSMISIMFFYHIVCNLAVQTIQILQGYIHLVSFSFETFIFFLNVWILYLFFFHHGLTVHYPLILDRKIILLPGFTPDLLITLDFDAAPN